MLQCRAFGSPHIATMAAVAAAVATTAASVQAVAADFYAGKTLTIVAGTGAGGGHDIFARMLARHLPKYIAGAPTIIVQNMPGAGGKRATDYIFNQVPKDGTVIGGVFPGAILGPLLYDNQKVRYDPLKFEYIGSGDADTRICATLKTSAIKSFKDLTTLAKPANFGASGPGGSTYDYAQMIANLAGAKVKMVTGYRGTPPITLAMERGEVDALCGWGWSIFKSERSGWKTNNPFNFLVQMSITPEPELTALGVPDFATFLGAEEKKVAALILSQQAFSRPYIAPPGVPADRVALLRSAFSKALADPALVGEFAKINIKNSPMTGADLQKMIVSLYASPPDIIAKARVALKEQGGATPPSAQKKK